MSDIEKRIDAFVENQFSTDCKDTLHQWPWFADNIYERGADSLKPMLVKLYETLDSIASIYFDERLSQQLAREKLSEVNAMLGSGGESE